MAGFDKQRIDALLHDLHVWDPDEVLDVDGMARRHQLDPMIVRRVAESLDLDLADEYGVPDLVDEDAVTGPVD